MFSSVKVEGKIFGGQKELELFQKNSKGELPHWSSIYGRNGSGKSSLAQAFFQYTFPSNPFESTVCRLKDSDTTSETNKQSIFVFGTDFIRERMRFEQSELGAIVLLGKGKDYQSQIDSLEIKQKRLTDSLERLNVQKEKADQVLKQSATALMSGFQGDNNYAGLIKKLENRKINSSVTLNIITNMFSVFDTGKETESYEGINKLINGYLKNSGRVEIPSISFDTQKLSAAILDAKAKLSEMPASVSSQYPAIYERLTARTVHQNEVSGFYDSDQLFCPTCLQLKDEVLHQIIIEVLNEIELDKVITNLKDSLKKAKEIFSNQLDTLSQLQATVFGFCEVVDIGDFDDALTSLVNFINAIIKAISLKLASPFSDVCFPNDSVEVQYAEEESSNSSYEQRFYNSITVLNRGIEEFNTQVRNIRATKKKIQEAIMCWACRNNIDRWETYKNNNHEVKSISAYITANTQIYTFIGKQIQGLLASLRNIKIASGVINDSLSLVFMNPNRISLRVVDGQYQIIVNNQHVPLKDLSDGEKNAIALTYFFTTLYEGKEITNPEFSQDVLLVIDDPISSLDRFNEVGIFSFVFHQITLLKRYVENSGFQLQVLILSHSFHVLQQFEAFHKRIFANEKYSSAVAELKQGNIEKSTLSSYNYRKLAKHIYEFLVKSRSDVDETPFIGNELRRILEEYCYFVFAQDTEGVLSADSNQNQQIIDILQTSLNNKDVDSKRSKGLIDLLLLLNFRLLMNNESHGEDIVKDDNISHDSRVDPEEIRATAKLLLIFLDLVHPTGLKGIIGRHCDREIKQWIDEFVPSSQENI